MQYTTAHFKRNSAETSWNTKLNEMANWTTFLTQPQAPSQFFLYCLTKAEFATHLWSLRRNAHWRFTTIPSTHAVNLYTVMSGYIFSHFWTALSCSRPPQYACYTVTGTPHWLRLLWTSDQSDKATCTWQHTTLPTDSHQCPRGFRTRKPSKTLPADARLRPLGHCDCPSYSLCAVDNRYMACCLVQSLLSLFR
jgi:hypothetical protein